MYCSLRIYIDKTPDLVSAQNILDLFDLFSSISGKSYDYISHMLFDPDKDRTLIDEKYTYDLVGRKVFVDTNILPVIIGKHGDLSAPFITATCIGKDSQLYSVQRVQIQFPVSSEPFIIRADYAQKGAKKLTLETYNFMIQALVAMGFSVNNCFYHVYRNKNEAATLDCGQIGAVINYHSRCNLKNSLMHQKKGYLNRLMGIYCANSIRTDLLSEEMLEEIVDIVGNNNVIFEGNICSFSLGNVEEITPAYRIKYAIMMKKLEKMLVT